MIPYEQNSEEAERLGLYESWPQIPPKIRRAILLMIDATTEHELEIIGEPFKETVSQGGGVSMSPSGGDERSEPEGLTKFPHGALPSVVNSTPTAEIERKK